MRGSYVAELCILQKCTQYTMKWSNLKNGRGKKSLASYAKASLSTRLASSLDTDTNCSNLNLFFFVQHPRKWQATCLAHFSFKCQSIGCLLFQLCSPPPDHAKPICKPSRDARV